ncbi:hypothetical protein WR25_20484 [Diploscapter pachys]|uniref:PHD-type domain-containing protein n=1 Tax=Diploscapter pachys TaxID=2018661 RepID=A0A2A2JRZ9_9BILA|nr:hypothetical protein WR25_20484 [Diploscapter pachys]
MKKEIKDEKESEPGPSTSKQSSQSNGETGTEAVETKKPARKRARRRRHNPDAEEYMEVKSKANKLKEKFGKKKSEGSDAAYLKPKGNKVKTINCSSHDKYITRSEEFQINKIYQVDFRNDVTPTQWKCALCHGYSGRDDLGDLFGPYYVALNADSHWPNHLCKKPTKGHNFPVDIDVWFHGDCVLWAPGIHMKGAVLTDLNENLERFWKQPCAVCKKEGASIQIGTNKFAHFPCAKKQDYKMDWSLLSCRAN